MAKVLAITNEPTMMASPANSSRNAVRNRSCCFGPAWFSLVTLLLLTTSMRRGRTRSMAARTCAMSRPLSTITSTASILPVSPSSAGAWIGAKRMTDVPPGESALPKRTIPTTFIERGSFFVSTRAIEPTVSEPFRALSRSMAISSLATGARPVDRRNGVTRSSLAHEEAIGCGPVSASPLTTFSFRPTRYAVPSTRGTAAATPGMERTFSATPASIRPRKTTPCLARSLA